MVIVRGVDVQGSGRTNTTDYPMIKADRDSERSGHFEVAAAQ